MCFIIIMTTLTKLCLEAVLYTKEQYDFFYMLVTLIEKLIKQVPDTMIYMYMYNTYRLDCIRSITEKELNNSPIPSSSQ